MKLRGGRPVSRRGRDNDGKVVSKNMRNIAQIMTSRPVEVARCPQNLSIFLNKFPNGRHLVRNLGFFRNQVKIEINDTFSYFTCKISRK